MNQFSEELYKEIDKRIEEMEASDYEQVARMKKKDFVLAGVLCVLSLVVMIGTYLQL